jgi:hypothetical protein
MIAALLALLGCKEKVAPGFEPLVEKAMNDLRAKTASHQTAWGLGKAERWDVNQGDGRLIFTFPDKVVSCDVQIIGSFAKSQGTWLWSWDNPSVLSNLTLASRELRDYGRAHGYAKLTQAKWKATEEDAWQMVALATLVGNAQGAYRGPAGDTYVFMTFGPPRIEPRRRAEPSGAANRVQPDGSETNRTSAAAGPGG